MERLLNAISLLISNDADAIFSAFSLACNCFGLNVKGFLEAMKTQPKKVQDLWTKLCWYWIKHLSKTYCEGRYDDRNKNACQKSLTMYSDYTRKYGDLPELDRTDLTAVFVSKMAYDHRTLQQSFSQLAFIWLDYLAREKGNRKAKAAINCFMSDSRWYYCPMI